MSLLSINFSYMWSWVTQISNFGSLLGGLADLFILIYTGRYLYYISKRTIDLSCGSLKMKRKDISVQNVTNAVSMNFFQGGKVPDSVRHEILKKIGPKVNVVKIDKE